MSSGPLPVVVTVLNDRAGFEELLSALAAQSRWPDELIVVDAGSTDGTREVALRTAAEGPFPVRLIDARGAGISAGRNVGLQAAGSEWVACTDAGCRPAPGWLAAIDAARDDAEFVAGTYHVIGETPLERALAVALYPSPHDPLEPAPWQRVWHAIFGQRYGIERATGRSMAFTRGAWEDAGGFPEDVTAGEDVAFATAVAAAGRRCTLVHEARVAWRPRPTWGSNARMYARYGSGDVRKAGRGRQTVRSAGWLAAAVLARRGPAARLLVALGATFYLAVPIRRARIEALPVREWWRLPAALAMKDAALLYGSAAGLLYAVRARCQPLRRRTSASFRARRGAPWRGGPGRRGAASGSQGPGSQPQASR